MLVDPTKVHAVNYEGQFFKTRGPLNSGPAPQGRPVIAQAGGSPRGRQFAAQHADTIVAHTKGIAAMKAYRDDVRARMVACGRDPDDCKVLFLVAPIIGETEADAQERKRMRAAARAEAQIAAAAGASRQGDEHRFRQVRPRQAAAGRPHHQRPSADAGPVPRRWPPADAPRRRWASTTSTALSVELIGTPDSVAARMGEVMEEVGGDGFLFSMPNVSRRSAGRDRGRAGARRCRTAAWCARIQPHAFRDNLLEF